MGTLHETIFIINPESENAVVEQTIDDVRNFIESSGYEIKKVDPWGRKRLAYEVKGHQEGYYILMVFESESDFVEQLHRRYRITEPIIKYMVVRFEGDLTELPAKLAESAAEASEEAIESTEREESDAESDETEEE